MVYSKSLGYCVQYNSGGDDAIRLYILNETTNCEIQTGYDIEIYYERLDCLNINQKYFKLFRNQKKIQLSGGEIIEQDQSLFIMLIQIILAISFFYVVFIIYSISVCVLRFKDDKKNYILENHDEFKTDDEYENKTLSRFMNIIKMIIFFCASTIYDGYMILVYFASVGVISIRKGTMYKFLDDHVNNWNLFFVIIVVVVQIFVCLIYFLYYLYYYKVKTSFFKFLVVYGIWKESYYYKFLSAITYTVIVMISCSITANSLLMIRIDGHMWLALDNTIRKNEYVVNHYLSIAVYPSIIRTIVAVGSIFKVINIITYDDICGENFIRNLPKEINKVTIPFFTEVLKMNETSTLKGITDSLLIKNEKLINEKYLKNLDENEKSILRKHFTSLKDDSVLMVYCKMNIFSKAWWKVLCNFCCCCCAKSQKVTDDEHPKDVKVQIEKQIDDDGNDDKQKTSELEIIKTEESEKLIDKIEDRVQDVKEQE